MGYIKIIGSLSRELNLYITMHGNAAMILLFMILESELQYAILSLFCEMIYR